MRTRFAPSPTGYLHVGGLRTALFSWLLARQSGGQFLLRIEDTDQERFVPDSVEGILQCLHWAGLDPDEGVIMTDGQIAQRGPKGPYIQSERKDLYKEHALKLIEAGHAYYAFDTKEELDAMRARLQASGNPAPKYDWSVRMQMKNSLTLSAEETQAKLDAGEPYVIRMKTPSDRVISFDDEIRGHVEFHGKTLDDQVLMKSDGHATYHLAHVVDDHFMGIDIVIRGEEWLPSAPKHLVLFDMLGWPAPRYAHVALLLNTDKTKLSKRTGSVSVQEYIDKGYLPEAMLNFLVMLGWNPGTAQDVLSIPEMIEQFSLDRVQKSGAIFDLTKLDWLQGQWMRKMDSIEFAFKVKPLITEKYPQAEKDSRLIDRVIQLQERLNFFHEAPEMMSYYYEEPVITKELLISEKQKVTEEALPKILELLMNYFNTTDDDPLDWHPETIKNDLMPLIESGSYKPGQVLWPLRAALTGKKFSPGAYEVAAELGKEATLRRLNAARNLFL